MGAVVVFIAAWGAGDLICGGIHLRGAERLALRMYSGLAVISAATMLVGSFSLLAAWVIVAGYAIAVTVFALRRWRNASVTQRAHYHSRGGGNLLHHEPADRSRAIPLLVLISFAAIVLANVIAVIAALAPITSWDAATAHLAVPAAHARAGHVGLDLGNVYSAYPQLLHSVLALVYTIDGERGAAIVAWALCVLACLAVYALANRVAQGATLASHPQDEPGLSPLSSPASPSAIAGTTAAAIFATAPIYSAQSGTVAIDVAFAGFIACSLLAIVLWESTADRRMLVLASIVAGSACGIRHTAYLVVVLILAWLLFRARPPRIRPAATFAAAAAIASAPWWLRSWILVGNPVYPLLTGILGDGGMPDVQVTAPLQHETARSAGVLDLATFPWRILMHPDQFDGWQASAGGLSLALGAVGALTGGRIARRLGALSLAGIVTIYYVQRFARYLLPFFMPLHVLSGVAVAQLRPLRRPLAILLGFSYIYGLALAAGMMYFKLPAALGIESRDHYFNRRLERWPAFDWANRNLDPQATVLTLDPRAYYLRAPAFTNLAELSRIAQESEESRLFWMQRHGIRYILVPEAYVSATPIFREWGIAPLVESWRAQPDRFVPIYDAAMPDPRNGVIERVVIYEVVWGDAGGHP